MKKAVRNAKTVDTQNANMKRTHKLYGAILGDLAGQPYEFPVMKGPYTNVDLHNPKSHITDDTIMTLASANYILDHKKDGLPISHYYWWWGNTYHDAGYGKGFKQWLMDGPNVIGESWGNGCLMRASPFMYTKDLPGLVQSVQCSHNNEDSFEAVFHLWQMYKGRFHTGHGRYLKFKEFVVKATPTIEFIEEAFDFNQCTQNLITRVIECGGDTDTNASIIGELGNYWKQDLTKKDIEYVESKLDKRQLDILRKFNKLC